MSSTFTKATKSQDSRLQTHYIMHNIMEIGNIVVTNSVNYQDKHLEIFSNAHNHIQKNCEGNPTCFLWCCWPTILFKLFVLSEILHFQHLQTYLFTAYILYTYYYIHILLVGLDDNGGINYKYWSYSCSGINPNKIAFTGSWHQHKSQQRLCWCWPRAATAWTSSSSATHVAASVVTVCAGGDQLQDARFGAPKKVEVLSLFVCICVARALNRRAAFSFHVDTCIFPLD
jgi:hypothetical protein